MWRSVCLHVLISAFATEAVRDIMTGLFTISAGMSVSWFFAGASNLLFTQSRAMWPILRQEKQVICLDTEGDLWEKVLFRGVVSFLTTGGSM
jgi:hypothetical protein